MRRTIILAVLILLGGVMGTPVSGVTIPPYIGDPSPEFPIDPFTPPSRVSNIYASSYRSGVALGWSRPEDESLVFKIFRGVTATNLAEIASVSNQTSFFLDTPTPGKVGSTFYYAVRVLNLRGVKSDFSPIAKIKIGAPSLDLDGDGLVDPWELAYRLDPDKADTDRNGVLDGMEDIDGDGLANKWEHDTGTFPGINTSFYHPSAPPVFTGPKVGKARKGERFSLQVVFSNFPDSYGANGLPEGLSIDFVTGEISGIPLKAGSFDVTVDASNEAGVSADYLQLVVKDADVRRGKKDSEQPKLSAPRETQTSKPEIQNKHDGGNRPPHTIFRRIWSWFTDLF